MHSASFPFFLLSSLRDILAPAAEKPLFSSGRATNNGMVKPMEKVRVEKQGRILLPKKVRERPGLQEGEQLQLAERDGAIILTPVLSPQEFAAGSGAA